MISSLTWIGPLLRIESSTTARLTGTPFTLSTLLAPGLQAFQMILTVLLLSSATQCFLAWILLFPLLTSLVKNIPQVVQFTVYQSCELQKPLLQGMEASSNTTFKKFFHPPTQHLHQNHKKFQIIFCPMHQQKNCFLPGWLSLLLVYGQSGPPKLLPIIFLSTKKQV